MGGGLAGMVTRQLGAGTVGNMAAQTLLSGMQAYTTGLVTRALSGVYWDGDGLAFSNEVFDSKSMAASIASAMAGTLVTQYLDGGSIVQSAKPEQEGLKASDLFKVPDVGTLNKLLGNLAGSAATYGVTGNVMFNLANIYGTGVLEMHTGDEGFKLKLGSGGENIGIYEVIMAGMEVGRAKKEINSHEKGWDIKSFDATVVHIDPLGWGSGTVQNALGFFDFYDTLAKLVGMDLDAISISLGDKYQLRVWKGNYRIWGGNGGEYAIYTKNGRSLTKKEMFEELGIVDMELFVMAKDDKDNLNLAYRELDPGHWAHTNDARLFGRKLTKDQIYITGNIKFNDTDSSTRMDKWLKNAFSPDNDEKPLEYKHNHNEQFDHRSVGSTLRIKYGGLFEK
jgi:hypothetical protein